MLHELAHASGVRRDAGDAALSKYDASVLEGLDAAQQAIGDYGLEHVELELPRLGGHRHSHVAADDVEADLIHDFGDYGIHFAWHDRRARLHRRQVDLAKTCAWPRAQQ